MVNWQNIDTVLLDMDGTLLDLHYDNYFWLSYLPQRYANIHGTSLSQAKKIVENHSHTVRGTLKWYCLDYWSDILKLDIVLLKKEVQYKIKERPHCRDFLDFLLVNDKKVALVTNAHPQTLALKLSLTSIGEQLDNIVSSHQFQQPKESQIFWKMLHEQLDFDPERTLFIDDTVQILRAAEKFGIKHIMAIHQPDSQIQRTVDDIPAFYHFDEIM